MNDNDSSDVFLAHCRC